MSDLAPGQMQLQDSFRPGLDDGSYTVEAKHSLGVTEAEISPAKHAFRIVGPRFALDPAEVHATFPPAGATGQFAEVLPHVVLTKRLLPWERKVPDLDPSHPWLALLLLQEEELWPEGPAAGTGSQTTTVGEALALPGVRLPKKLTPTDEERESSCRTLTVDGALLPQLLPLAEELPLLAHVRTVPVTDRPAGPEMLDEGVFSVIVANRFPESGPAPAGGKRAVAHLVSLEGHADLLGATPTPGPVLLFSLASWTFSCLEDPAQTFAGLATNLSRQSPGGPAREPGSLMLRIPATAAGGGEDEAGAQQRLREGYAALGWHTRSGEDSFAWYRGPLAPVVAATIEKEGPFQGSAAAMAFDPTTGVFDHSLAAAWELGRGLALANESFGTTLMRVRRRAAAKVTALAHPDAGTGAEADPGAAQHHRLGRVFAHGIADAVRALTHHGRGAGETRPRQEQTGHPAQLGAQLADPAVLEAVAQAAATDPDLATVAAWVGGLELLQGVPLEHLVPDARMLPPESIRFFYLDPNWIEAAIDGALSLGIGTAMDARLHPALLPEIQRQAAEYARAWRATQLGETPPPEPTGPTAGVLLRSALVPGWPGLTVSGKGVPLLRLERLSPTILLGLFAGVPSSVAIGQPHEGLEFGVEEEGEIVLRSLSGNIGEKAGELTVYRQGKDAAAPFMRAGGRRVLDIAGGGGDLRTAIARELHGIAPAALGPSALALQMLKTPAQLSFEGSGE
jgi:hypothetical protein